MTPLARLIAGIIAQEGPISLARYMALCLGHPAHGYYMTRDPFGRGGDFTTAPEISQMFGEMLGVWTLSVWDAMGRPPRVALVELGPGRGTLMADVLRSARALPGFLDAAGVHLVEISPALRATQERALAPLGIPVSWHRDPGDVPGGPAIILANEFFDALPVRQFVRDRDGWRERLVGFAEGRFFHGLGPAAAGEDAPEGAIRETCPEAQGVIAALSGRLVAEGGALLAVDYGYAAPAFGDSVQAMAGHAFVDPLADPGEADVTAHVDFAALAAVARGAGAQAHPLLTQGTLLTRLGIGARAAALARRHPERAGDIRAAFDRLTGKGQGQMGGLFKALAVTSPGLVPPAFDTPDALIDTVTA